MFERLEFSSRLRGLLAESPAVAILGPRQCGKTTLAQGLDSPYALYLDLEAPSDLARLSDAELFLESCRERLVILDEIQRRPDLFALLRSLIDRDRRPGRFLLLGSASPDLVRGVSESLAGRVRFLELTPLRLDETGPLDWRRSFLRGGFPPSLLAGSEDSSLGWRTDFVQTLLERDIPQLGFRLQAPRLRRFWTMLAHAQGSLWNASSFARGLDIAPANLEHWLDVLEGTYMVRRLLPYLPNVRKRLIKSPKVYVRDSGVAHGLLGIRSWEDLQAHPVVGHSWEGFALEEVMARGRTGAQAFFHRTSNGAEVDLVVEPVPGAPVGIEIKYSLSPKPSRGFWEGLEDLSASRGFVLHPGSESWPLRQNAWALGIADWHRVWSTEGLAVRPLEAGEAPRRLEMPRPPRRR
jgi:hypothetical protein